AKVQRAMKRETAAAYRQSSGNQPLCEAEQCQELGTHPAPTHRRGPHRGRRIWLCPSHIAKYNKHWNYFALHNPAEITQEMNAHAVGDHRSINQTSPYAQDKSSLRASFWGSPDGSPGGSPYQGFPPPPGGQAHQSQHASADEATENPDSRTARADATRADTTTKGYHSASRAAAAERLGKDGQRRARQNEQAADSDLPTILIVDAEGKRACDLLGLPRIFSLVELRMAHRRLVKRHHPDAVSPSANEKHQQVNLRQMQLLNNAYSILKRRFDQGQHT
ncbi:MAG: J domain-containing protein, partial [Alphaproteobacteria bacterium]|nr:J domain-containing protein [Alphaproteobacteria bacterium]